MPDREPAADPIDKAYAEAEALLSDEQARSARRARVLHAVAAEANAPASPIRRSIWRRGGWLAAASVAGLSALLTFHSRTPAPVQLPPPPASAPAAMAPARTPAPAPMSAAAPATEAALQKPEPPATAAAPAREELAPLSEAVPALPVPAAPPPPPPPPSPMVAQPTEASPEAPRDVVVTARRAASRIEEEPRSAPRGRAGGAAQADFAAPKAFAPARAQKSTAGMLRDETDRLHAAAAAGRTAELEDLLAEGVPVDAPDAEGDTALMKSIEADQPAAAALLRRKGASLDRRNHAGASARDMAASRDDVELDRALGLEP